MSRRPRVPGTTSSTWRREVACGIDPTAALVRALAELPASGGRVWSIGVRHDDGCGSLEARRAA